MRVTVESQLPTSEHFYRIRCSFENATKHSGMNRVLPGIFQEHLHVGTHRRLGIPITLFALVLWANSALLSLQTNEKSCRISCPHQALLHAGSCRIFSWPAASHRLTVVLGDLQTVSTSVLAAKGNQFRKGAVPTRSSERMSPYQVGLVRTK